MIAIPFFGTTGADGTLIMTRKIDHAQRVFKVRWIVGGFDAGVDAVLASAGLGIVAPGLTVDDRTILTLTNANVDAWYQVTDADNGLVDQVLKLTVSSGGASKAGGCIVYVGEQSEATASGNASAANQATGNASLATIAALSKAEDAVHASADPGVMALAVRKDTAAALAGTDGDYIPLIVDANGRLHIADTRESWRVATQSFTTVDLSTKTFTVPATTEWQIFSLYITLASTATAGNRVMVVQALTSGDAIIKEYVFPVTQAASLTYRYELGPDMPNDAALVDTTLLRMTFAPLLLTAGQKLKVFDRAAIAAAADDMTIQMQTASRSIA